MTEKPSKYFVEVLKENLKKFRDAKEFYQLTLTEEGALNTVISALASCVNMQNRGYKTRI